MPEVSLPLPQSLLLRDRESNIRNIVVGITVNNPVRRIALVVTAIGITVTGIYVFDPVEAVSVELVIRHADEVARKHSYEWVVVVVDVVVVVVAVRPSTVSPCPFRRRVVVNADLTIPALPIRGAPILRSG